MDAALSGRLAQLDAMPIRLEDGRLAARRRADAMDAAIRRLAPPDLRRAAIAAVGGYGRSELTPGSDIDLLVVYEPDAEDEAAGVVEAVLYPLWDAGMRVGHAVRTLGETVFEARRTLESLTSLLSARLLDGPELMVELVRNAAADVVRDDLVGFGERLRTARLERERRHGRIGHVQEPDIKESLGGLRDLQTIGWLAASSGAASPAFAERADALSGDALDTILAVRAALHRVAGGQEDRLADAHQASVAEALGIEAEPGWEARDVLMRTLAATGRRVASVVDGLLAPAGANEAVDELDRELGELPDGTWSAAALGRFEALLAEGRGGDAVDAVDARGLVATLLPGWPDLQGRPQHDPYHRYPVDVHLTEAAAVAARLLRAIRDGETEHPGDDPVAAAAAGAIADPGALLLGALLHDCGKVGRGSHVPIGVENATRILDRMGIEPPRRDAVLFLVREHLLLSDIATRRNLDDEDLILHVAARVRDRERLGLLYLLTLADAEATGPSASTPWRLGLIRELVARVDRAFDRGLMDPDQAASVERAEAEIRAALAAAGVAPERADRFVDATPPAYALWVDPAESPAHLDLIDPTPAPNEARIRIVPGRSPDMPAAVTIGAHDRLGLLGTIAGAFAVSGISILSARAFTTSDGVALDAFDVRQSFEEEGISDERWNRFAALLGGALDGTVDLDARVAEWWSIYRAPSPDVPVKVTVANDVSDFFTLFEVQAADRLGLLFDLARAFSANALDVHVAQVATYGPRVVDVFYATEGTGGRIEDPVRIDGLRAALAAAASRAPGPDDPSAGPSHDPGADPGTDPGTTAP